jgi:pimeloyl-ACP methyl ester carboxylesterase
LKRNLQTWRLYGYVTALKDDYQLILKDPRGHENSEKPHDANAYTPKRMIGDVVAVLDNLSIAQAYYWGARARSALDVTTAVSTEFKG